MRAAGGAAAGGFSGIGMDSLPKAAVTLHIAAHACMHFMSSCLAGLGAWPGSQQGSAFWSAAWAMAAMPDIGMSIIA